MSTARLKIWWRARRADAAALACIVLAFCAAFGWAIFRGRFLIGGDVFFYTYPLRTVAWRMIRHGELPLWTPLVLSGFPLLAMVQLGLAYPLTWLHLFLPDHWAEEIYVLAPFLLAPAFTYAYARELGRSRLASLLAGLAYGYSGLTTNALGMNAIPTNAMMWLPLLLIALERARTRRLLPTLLGATIAYTLPVLTGHAQSFLLVGLVAGAYALCLALVPTADEIEQARASTATNKRTHSWLKRSRWRPLFVAACAGVLSFGVAAFQLLETLRAARRSIRHSITYDFFSQGSFTPSAAILSFIAPLYHYIDVTTYVAPLACALALYAVLWAMRRRETSDPRICFWLAVAVGALLFMLGEHTPLYHFAYYIPIINLFRIPSRHAFEWTFALSLLAAYGWDALRATYAARQRIETEASDRRRSFVVAALLALTALVGALWFLSVNRVSIFGLLPVTQHGRAYGAWKFIFTAGVLLVVWRTQHFGVALWRKQVLVCALLLGCMCEPLILISQWWPGTAKPAARFTTPGRATRYLQQFAPEQHRVYVHANLGVDENAVAPRFDVLDGTALYGLHNVGGYESLMLERYSRALGDVDYDAVRPRAGHAPPRELFAPESHVLDLLNTSFVVAFSDLDAPPVELLTKREQFGFAQSDLALELQPGTSTEINGADNTGDTLAVVTSLANSVALAQGTPVARLRLHTADGRIIERTLRAGLDTSEWAHERADVRAVVKHALAPIFDTQAGDATDSFRAQRYWARLSLDARTSVSKIEITNTTQAAALAIWKATLYDSTDKRSTPLTNNAARPSLDPARWPKVAEFDGVIVLRNTRACPRAWLVAEAEAVDGEEALRRIRGASTHEFDPRRTALIEARADELPQLPGGAVAPASDARIINYAANKLMIETSAPTPTVLIVSEIFYPGWEAKVDGRATQILLTDYLLRGVALPAGTHIVEMRYAAPAARHGALISALTLLLLCALAIYAWLTAKT